MDAEEGSELTLAGLAQRLETQAQRLEELECENAELRSKVATLEGSETPRDGEAPASGEFAGRLVSRRALLSKAGATAFLGAVAAGTLLNPRQAKANHLGPGIDVGAVRVHSDNTFAVWAVSGGPGKSTGRGGVFGFSYNGEWPGVQGSNLDAGLKGIGVLGKGDPGVQGEGTLPHRAGVLGRNPNGYGGEFEGGKAQLRLFPGSSAGKPTTGVHFRGELYLDSAGTLFVCTQQGIPGTWRRVQTAAT